MSPEERAELEHEVNVIRARRLTTSDDREHQRLGLYLDSLCDRLAAPDGFDTLAEFRELDHIMRQPPR